jgi:hypothetical protein
MLKEVYTKLKVKSGMKLLILNAPDGYLTGSDTMDNKMETEANEIEFPFVQLFTKNTDELQAWAEKSVRSLEKDGLLWICYPKKTSSLYENLSRDEGWEAITSLGFEGVSLISVDDTWSAMRFRPKGAAAARDRKPANRETNKVRAEFEKPIELERKLQNEPEAAAFLEGLAPSYKQAYFEWIVSAKRDETKQKRILETIEKLKAGFKNPYAK